MKVLNYYQFINESISQKRAIIITDNGFQDQELFDPKISLESNGFSVSICSTSLGEIKSYNSDKTVEVDSIIDQVQPDDFDILILPGGKAPETLRKNKEVLTFVKEFYNTGKPIAAICHGPLILVSAGLVEGKNMTCYEDAKDELVDAGANYQDKSLVVDGQFITSRNPKDLPDFCQKISSQ